MNKRDALDWGLDRIDKACKRAAKPTPEQKPPIKIIHPNDPPQPATKPDAVFVDEAARIFRSHDTPPDEALLRQCHRRIEELEQELKSATHKADVEREELNRLSARGVSAARERERAYNEIYHLKAELNDRNTYCQRLKEEYGSSRSRQRWQEKLNKLKRELNDALKVKLQTSKRAIAIAAMIGGLGEPCLDDWERSYPAQSDSEPANTGWKRYDCGFTGDIYAEDPSEEGILAILEEAGLFIPGPDPQVFIDKRSGRITIETPYDEE